MSYDSWIRFNSSTSDFESAIAKLGVLDQRIPEVVGDAIKAELDDLTEQAKAKLLGEPVHGLKQTGLRARIAAGVEVVRTTDGYQAQVTVDDNEIIPLPWGLDLESKGWDHPVFGREPRVHQQGTVPWWSETMDKAQPNLEEKLPVKIDEAIHETFGE